jgi:hypothetical protein
LQAFGGLLDIMDELRENVRGIKKNKRCVIYHRRNPRIGDAILDNNFGKSKELGDLLCTLFYAKIGSETVVRLWLQV